MPKLTAGKKPPTHYYANILTSVVQSVLDQYDDLLLTEESQVAKGILALSDDGIRLLARLVIRTKQLLRVDSLNYQEVSNLDFALAELAKNELIEINEFDETWEHLELLTIPELKSKFKKARSEKTKGDIIDTVLSEYDEDEIYSRIRLVTSWVAFTADVEISLFSFLFFGNSHQQLSEFVLRDLGITRFESYELAKEHRFFTSRSMLERFLLINAASEFVHELGAEIPREDVYDLYDELKEFESDRILERRRSQLLNALGRNLERQKNWNLALQCYACSTQHPARERTMRVLARLKRHGEVEQTRQTIFANPYSLEELQFATNFKKKHSTELSFPTQVHTAPSDLNGTIEEYAIDQLSREGRLAHHLENALPNTLFGLAYWEWLFAPVRGAFVHAFQSQPLDVYWPEFFQIREDLCEDPLANPSNIKDHLSRIATQKRGINNSFVSWSTFYTEILSSILKCLTTDQIVSLLSIFKSDIRQFSSGFPDLTVLNADDTISFIEVKGPGDQLRPNQKIWFERFSQYDLPASVLVYR